MKPKPHRLFVSSITAVIGATIPMASHAADATWNQTAAGTTYSWLTPANWTPTAFPNGIGNIANLNNNIVGAQTVGLNQVISLGTLNIGDSNGTHSMTLNSGIGGSLIMDVASGSAAITKTAGAALQDNITTGIQFNDNLVITNNAAGSLAFTGALRSLTSDITFNGSGGFSAFSGAFNTAGNLVKNGGGTLSWGAAAFAGNVTINGGTLNPTSGSSLSPFSAITVNSPGTLDFATLAGTAKNIGSLSGDGTVTLSNPSGARRDISIGRANTDSTFNGQFLGPVTKNLLGIFKTGTGTLTLAPLSGSSGTAAGDHTGITAAIGGTLKLDFSQGSFSDTSMLASAPLSIAGGNLEVKGRSGASIDQSFSSLTLGVAGGSIIIDNNGGTATRLNLGAITSTTAGGSLLVNSPSGADVRFGTALNTATTVNGRIVFTGDGTTFNWAANTGANTTTVGLSTYTDVAGGATTGTDTNNSRIASAVASEATTLGGAWTTNSLRIDAGATGQSLVLGANNLTLTNGGLLFTGANDYSITSTTGTLKSNTATASDLVLHNYGAGNLTIGAIIANGVGASTLTTAGTGKITLTGANTFTGAVIVGGSSTLSFSSVTAAAAGSLGNGSATAVTIGDEATLQYTGGTGTIAATGAGGHTYALNNGNSTIEVTGSTTELTLAGVISGSSGGGLTVKGAAGSVLKLSGVNTYNGDTRILANATARAGVATSAFGSQSRTTVDGTLDVNGFATTLGSLAGAGTVTNSTGTVSTLTIGGTNVSSSYSGTFTGTTDFANVLTKNGTGIQTLSGSTSQWTGATNVNSGVLRLGASDTLNAATAVTISNAAGPAQLELGANFTQTVAGLTFGGASGAASSQGNVLIGSSATMTLAGNVTYTATNNPLGAVISGAGALSVGGATRTFNVGNSTAVQPSEAELTVSAPISSVGAFGIDKTGAGTLLLTATNTYTGATTVSGGALVLANNAATGTASGGIAITGSQAATLQINSGITTLDDITFSNTNAVSSVKRTVAAATGLNTNDDYTTGTSGALKSSLTGGTDTTAQILAGTNSAGTDATLTMSFSTTNAAANDAIRRSDAFSVSGTTGTDAYVLQLTASSLAADSVLGYSNGTVWDLAVTNNTGAGSLAGYHASSWTSFFSANGGVFNADMLGAHGYDSGGTSVWAVVNYGNVAGGAFAAVPEPTSALAGLLIAAGLLRRRRVA